MGAIQRNQEAIKTPWQQASDEHSEMRVQRQNWGVMGGLHTGRKDEPVEEEKLVSTKELDVKSAQHWETSF